MKNFNDNNRCFVCGPANPHGMKLTFRYPGEGVAESDVIFPGHLQGWGNVAHGGLVSTVLDEVMIKAAAHSKYKCVTGEITVKFKKPTLVDQPCLLQGRVIEAKRKLVFTEGSLSDEKGQVLATAKGKLFTVD